MASYIHKEIENLFVSACKKCSPTTQLDVPTVIKRLEEKSELDLSYVLEQTTIHGNFDVLVILFSRYEVHSSIAHDLFPIACCGKYNPNHEGCVEIVEYLSDRFSLYQHRELLYKSLWCNFEVFKYLLKAFSIDKDFLDKEGWSPLTYIRTFGDVQYLDFLCNEFSVSLSHILSQDTNFLGSLCLYGYIDMLRYLCEKHGLSRRHFSSPPRCILDSPVNSAIHSNNYPLIKFLLGEIGLGLEDLEKHEVVCTDVKTLKILYKKLDKIPYPCHTFLEACFTDHLEMVKSIREKDLPDRDICLEAGCRGGPKVLRYLLQKFTPSEEEIKNLMRKYPVQRSLIRRATREETVTPEHSLLPSTNPQNPSQQPPLSPI